MNITRILEDRKKSDADFRKEYDVSLTLYYYLKTNYNYDNLEFYSSFIFLGQNY
jgi:hypothetical protein